MKHERYIAQTYLGLEKILAQELRQINLKVIEIRKRAVLFDADIEGMIQANLSLQTALHILKPIATFKAQNSDQLYKQIKKISWEQWLKSEGTFSIRITHTGAHTFNNTLYLRHRVKDGIVDRFRNQIGNRPSVDRDHPDCAIAVHLHQNQFTCSLDTSGGSLHKRGYRTEPFNAPLNEVLAAGLVKLTHWKGEMPLIDPMCGSGTILIEAALQQFHIPANIQRKNFSYLNWGEMYKNINNMVKKRLKKERHATKRILYGYDHSKEAMNTSITHFKNINLIQYLTLQQREITQHKIFNKPVTLLFNPPYNHRLKIKEKRAFIDTIQNSISRAYPHNKTWIFAPKDIHEFIQRDPLQSFSISNGGLDTVLNCYRV